MWASRVILTCQGIFVRTAMAAVLTWVIDDLPLRR
jgi:hypothetical protein